MQETETTLTTEAINTLQSGDLLRDRDGILWRVAQTLHQMGKAPLVTLERVLEAQDADQWVRIERK